MRLPKNDAELPNASYVILLHMLEEGAGIDDAAQQAVADAYYVLSDPARRAEYDSLFRSRPSSAFTDDKASEFEQEQASGSFFQNFSSFFQNATGGGAAHPRPDANGVFGDVFEEM